MSNLDLIIRDLRAQLPQLAILENEPMSRHCSFRIGGPVRAMVQPSSTEEAAEVCRVLRAAEIAPLIIGNGTNLLVTDAPLERIAVQFGEKMSAIERVGEDSLRAQCGVTLARLAATAQSWALSGMEFAHGIPGSLGGGVSMDAGAYGGEMKDILQSARVLMPDGRILACTPEDLQLSYRHSILDENGGLVLSAVFQLREGDPEQIAQRMRELAQKRREKQPLE